MYRKLLISIISVALTLLCCYFFQPIKKGIGMDTASHYVLVEDWPEIPENFILGNPTGLAIDKKENLVVFSRGNRAWPLIGSMPRSYIKEKTIHVINAKSGKILKSWGENLFIMPHGLTVDKNENVWVTDVGLHQVFKFNANGQLLLKLGAAGVSGNDRTHFNQPTDIAIAKDGSFYVSDGYGNSRIVKFSVSGRYLAEWGRKGDKPGEFEVPHGISLDSLDNVYVADRENNRIQVFDKNGRFLRQISNSSFGNMCSVAFNKSKNKLFAIDDLNFLKIKHKGADVMLFDEQDRIQTRFGRSSTAEIKSNWYHDIAIDKDENIYVGDILNNQLKKFKRIKYQ